MSTLATNTFQELATGDSVGAKYVVHGSAKAWANLNGTGTIALRDSFGVSSVVDNGVGLYTANFTAAFTDANYGSAAAGSNSTTGIRITAIGNSSASASRMTGGSPTIGASADIDMLNAVWVGDLA
jgi:hypothetical protein